MVDVSDLLSRIIDKKELRGINKAFAQQILDEWLEKHQRIKKLYEENPEQFVKKKEFSRVKSEVREQLRKVYGVFFTPQYAAKKKQRIQALIAQPDKEHAQEVLTLHRSTKERLEYYDILFSQLFTITGIPNSILDLGCGFNPFAYPYLGCTPAYHCADIACEDMHDIGIFLTSLGIVHSEHCIDLSNAAAVKKLPAVDVAFAFKLFDSLEDREWNITKKLLENIPAKHLVVSFPTKSIGQEKSIRPRQWFEALITNKVTTTVTLPNEQFFIITM